MSQQKQNSILFNQFAMDTISKLCSPLMEDLGIIFFSHVTLLDFSAFHISNNTKWTEYYLKQNMYDLNHYQEFIYKMGNQNKYIHLWDLYDKKKTTPIEKLARNLNVGQYCLTIYKRYEQHCEMWNFSTYHSEGFNYLANLIDYFERFIVYFKNEAASIIDLSDKSKLLKRKSKLILKPDYEAIEKQERNFIINTTLKQIRIESNGNIKITRREAECLYLLSQCKTIKEIARILNINPKTAEWYLNNLKTKFNCRYKSELIHGFNENLQDYYKPVMRQIQECIRKL